MSEPLPPVRLADDALIASAPRRRLAFIDFLRAVAILLVFVRHATEVFLPYGHGSRLLYDLSGWFNFGALGVSIFFAISGFLIPSSLHGPRLQGTVRYLISRVFRLYPAFLVSVIPSAVTQIWYPDHPFPWHAVLLNLTMLPRLFGAEMANGAYWTLEVETAFYLICLLLFIGGLLRETFSFAAITLVTFVVFQSSQQKFFGGVFNPVLTGPTYFFNMDIALMCWGAICRRWWSGTRLNLATAAIFWGIVVFWVLWRPAVLAHAALVHQLGDIDIKMIVAYGGAIAIFLAAVMHGGLRQPVMLWIGRISYSFYLLHGSVIHALRHVLNWYPVLQGYNVQIYSAVALVVTFAVSQLSYRWVERPGIVLGRILIERALRRIPAEGASLPAGIAALVTPLFAWPAMRVGGRGAWLRPSGGRSRGLAGPHEAFPPDA